MFIRDKMLKIIQLFYVFNIKDTIQIFGKHCLFSIVFDNIKILRISATRTNRLGIYISLKDIL